jgi:hypothetical protein
MEYLAVCALAPSCIKLCHFFVPNALKKGKRKSLTYHPESVAMFEEYGAYYSWSSNGIPQPNLLIMKGILQKCVSG